MSLFRPSALVSALILFSFSTSARALEVELDFDGSVLTIVDGDANDLNIDVSTIDFDVTDAINPSLSARGRVIERLKNVGQVTELTAIPPDAFGVLRNASAAAADFTVTVRSSAYAQVGPPLGWALSHQGEVADPAPDVVEVTNHSSTLSVDGDATPLQTVVVPDISQAGDPPVDLSDLLIIPVLGSSQSADATTTQLVLSMTLGPGDEFHAFADPDEDGDGFLAQVFNQELQCIKKMNQQASKAVKTGVKVDEKCVKQAASADPEPCVEDPLATKNEKVEEKIVGKFFPTFCAVPPPAWGVNAGTCCEDSANEGSVCADNADCSGGSCNAGACVSGAAVLASNGLAHDLFGSSVDVQTSENCTGKVQQAVDKVLATRWKTFFKCKKVNLNLITNDTELVTTCLAGSQTGDAAAAKAEAKIPKAVAQCDSPLATAFPGRCGDAADFSACVVERARCRFCQSVNFADDIVPAFDCDTFDNSSADLSCTDSASATTTTTTTTTLP